MIRLLRTLIGVAALVCALHATAATCNLTGQTCATAGCQTVTATNGSQACVCAKGTADPPSGCVIDTAVSCWDQRNTYTCPGPLVDCLADPDCSLSNQTCIAYGAGGDCTQSQQVYACTKRVKVCTKIQDLNSCTTINTEGLENQPAEANTNGLSKAMQSMALLQAIAKNISGTHPPVLFQGTLLTCNQEDICGSINPTSCCCSTSLKKSSGGRLGCSTDEVKLAGSRRQKLTHPLETCCSASLPVVGCVSHEQSFCAFDSILGRIIQEQGRAQLAALAAGGTGTTTQTPVTLSLFGTGAGAWLGPYNANGNDVWVYQWPSDCNLPATPASAPDTAAAMGCPASADQLWWAACDGAGCAAPTIAPPAMPADPSLYVLSTDGSDTTPAPSVALSKYVVVTGACTGTGNPACSYTLSGLTAGAATLQTDLSWSLYGQAGWNPPTTLGTDYQLSGYSLDLNGSPALGGAAPTAVSIEYATTDASSASGSYTSATLPVSIPATAPMALSGTNMTVWGSCSGPYFQCEYHVSEPGTAVAKPWDGGCSSGGDPVNPDCSGFTISQFMLLDLSQMNLGEWIASIQPSAPDTAAMNASATATASAIASTASATPPQTPVPAAFDTSGHQQTSLNLSISSCQVGEDCDLTAYATSNWPVTHSDAAANTAPVASVTLDWGDGTTQVLTATTVVNGLPVFSADHTYVTGGNFTVTADFTMSPSGTASADPSTALRHRAQAGVQAWIDDPPRDKTQQSTVGAGQLIPPPQ